MSQGFFVIQEMRVPGHFWHTFVHLPNAAICDFCITKYILLMLEAQAYAPHLDEWIVRI